MSPTNVNNRKSSVGNKKLWRRLKKEFTTAIEHPMTSHGEKMEHITVSKFERLITRDNNRAF